MIDYTVNNHVYILGYDWNSTIKCFADFALTDVDKAETCLKVLFDFWVDAVIIDKLMDKYNLVEIKAVLKSGDVIWTFFDWGFIEKEPPFISGLDLLANLEYMQYGR